MSRESAAALIARLKTDPTFAATVMAIADPGKRLEFLAAEGYSVSIGEFDTYSQELGDATLDTVAGGSNLPVLASLFVCAS